MVKRKATAQRKAFKRALEVLDDHFDDLGLVKTSAGEIADSLIELSEKTPPLRCSFWDIAASALYLYQMKDEFRTEANTHETCHGGEAFRAMYIAGYRAGFARATRATGRKKVSR